MNTYFFLGTNKFIAITLTILTLRLWEYLLRLTSSRLTSPIWAPPTVQLRRMTVFESFFFYRKALCAARIDEPSCPVPWLIFQTALVTLFEGVNSRDTLQEYGLL